MSKVLGIDLGTGFSCMSIYENGEAKVINNAEGARTTPSIVAFTKSGQRLVGVPALRQAITNPTRTIHSVKRLIGRKFSEIQNIVKLMPYKIVEGPNGKAMIEIDDKKYSPEEISSMVLAKLKTDAESFLGEKITDVVITVPAYFDDSQRQATKDAGTIAGFNVLRIINEPTAASLAFGIDKKKEDKTIAVFDIGKGTSDISILECGDGVFEVLATNGDSLLGGADFDEAIVKYIANKFNKENGVDLFKDNQALQRLTDAAEKAKIELSTASQTEINIPFISMNASGPIHLNETLTRAKFEELLSQVFDKFKTPCEQCIKDSGKQISEINEVLMVGGSTRVPYVQEFAKKIFNKDVNKGLNPDQVVAQGAAIQGAVLGGDKSVGDVVLLDVTSISYGIEVEGSIMAKLIESNTTIPTKKSEIFTTAADNQNAVTIRVFQGESKMTARNKLIGQFNLDGILPAPRGVPQIEVEFNIDSNGILSVSAKDKGTNKEQHITIQPNGGLSKDEIEKLKKEAELHAEEDQKAVKLIEVKNKAESMIYQIEKQMKEYEDKIDSTLKSEIESKLQTLKEVKDSGDFDKITNAINDTQQSLMKIGEQVYRNQQQSTQQTPPPNTNNNEDIVDAEVVE